MKLISSVVVPAVLCICALLILFSKKDLFKAFSAGAVQGMKTAVGLLPNLVIMCTAASMFTASGAGETVSKIIAPVTNALRIPSEIVPFLVVRPISGSASNSVISELFSKYGADSFAGICASVIAGSSDTLLYIVAVYFSAVKVKNTRHAVPAGVITMFAVIVFACFLSRVFL